MAKIGLAIYSLNIFDGQANATDLRNLYDGKDLFTVVKEFMESKKEKYEKTSREDTVIKSVDWEILVQYDCQENIGRQEKELLRCVYGRIKTGDYGVESEIVDTTTGEQTYHMDSTEARVMPFDFMIAMPKGVSDQALVVIQTQGIYGIKSELEYQLKKYIQDINSSLVLSFGRILPRAYVNNLLQNGIIKKIKLYRYDIPDDLVGSYGIVPTHKRKIEERTICSPEGFTRQMLEKIRECLRGQRSYCNVVEIDDFDPDDLKLEVKMSRSTKTISLKNLEKIVITEDITDQVVQEGGNPEKESIKNIMLQNIEEYEEQMNRYTFNDSRYNCVEDFMQDE